jgi:hypothetical protein
VLKGGETMASRASSADLSSARILVATIGALLAAACSATGAGSGVGTGGGAGTGGSAGAGAASGTAGWTVPDAAGGTGAAAPVGGAGGTGGTLGGGGSSDAGPGGVAGTNGASATGGTGGATNTLRLSIGPIDIAPGQETTLCIDMRMPTTEPFELVKIASELSEGGHHLIVYASPAQAEARTPYPCSASLDIIDPQMLPLFIAQQRHTTVSFPEGVAYKLPAARMLRFEMHFFNAKQNPVQASGTVDFTGADPARIVHHSNFMFWGPTQLFILPRSNASVTQFYRFNKTTPPNVFGLTTHTHSRGVRTTVQMGPDGAGRQIYENTNWEEPKLALFTPPLLAGSPNDGLRITCEYQNNTDNTLTFGESALLNEMCFLWAYYYPDQGHDTRVILP